MEKHSLEINNGRIYLDGFRIRFASEYELTSSAAYPRNDTELTIKLWVENSNILLDEGANHINSNLGEGIE